MHFQSIMMIQPIDILPDGRQNMCDGCPDVTAHDGQIVWSCRLEEYRTYGGLVTNVPRAKVNCSISAGCKSTNCDHEHHDPAKKAPAKAPTAPLS
jgi:hypothetical protein